MVAFNFSARFALLVKRGEKWQTIRLTARAKRGDRLQLYTGMRTKQCRKLVDPDPVCDWVGKVIITPKWFQFAEDSRVSTSIADRNLFAVRDGFEDYEDLLDWIAATYSSRTFEGYLHSWDTWERFNVKPSRAQRA